MAKETKMQTTEIELKAIAKAVGASLKRAGHPVPHSSMLHAVAAALDLRDWHKMKAALQPAPLSVQLASSAPAVQLQYSERAMFVTSQ